MSTDLQRFHATFFEESRENLDAMESGLLDLEAGRGGVDTIHTVFRAAHSIKGGSATFGFTAVAELTHVLETLLDELRAEKRPLTTDAVDAMLGSLDVLRALLQAYEGGKPPAPGFAAAVIARLEAVLTGKTVIAQHGGAAAAPAAKPAAPAKPAEPERHDIRFAPRESLFMSGNDPLRIVRELADLGPLSVSCDLSTLPAFAGLDPLSAYLAWNLSLPGSVPVAQIGEAFAWVEDECDLSITPYPPVAEAPAAEAAPAPAAAPADMGGRWQLSSPAGGACAVTVGPGTTEGTLAPEGGCPGNFYTSRKWTFEQGALVIRDHTGKALGQLTLVSPGRFEGQAAGGIALMLAR